MENLIKKWYDHGVLVHYWYNKLLDDPLVIGIDSVVEWFISYDRKDGIERYHLNHDMSKPYIIQYDSEGKAHYPDHSRRSYEMYCEKFGNDEFADMILNDMGFHILKNDQLIEHCKLSIAKDLYATAWAELFANAETFGGFNSDSFKIKRKKLIKALKYLTIPNHCAYN